MCNNHVDYATIFIAFFFLFYNSFDITSCFFLFLSLFLFNSIPEKS